MLVFIFINLNRGSIGSDFLGNCGGLESDWIYLRFLLFFLIKLIF